MKETMQVTVQRISPVLMELQIEVPADAVKFEVEKAYTTLAKKAHVKGFRPGKAPRDVLKHLYGPQVQNDVANAIVNETLPKALEEKTLTPVNMPSVVEAGKIDTKAAFSYKARFEVTPDVAEVKYEGFELVKQSAEVKGEEVDEELEKLRTRAAKLEPLNPPRPAKSGDVLTIDFTLFVDGKEVKDGGAEGVQLELGAQQALPELDAALTGKNVGDKVEATAKFPDQHPRPDFRGKNGLFKITLVAAKERVPPALDDEFAKDIGQFQTLVELRADLHTRLEKGAKERSEIAVAEQIVQKLNDNNPLEVPPSLVEQQCRAMEQEIMQQARRFGQRITQEQAQSLHGQVHADAEKKVRAGLLMAAIARKLELKVTDEDVENGFKELAEETGKNVAKVKAEYREKNKRDMFVGMILEDKILDIIEAKAKFVDEATAAKNAEKKSEKAEAKSEKASAREDAKESGGSKKETSKKEKSK
jgi:trigger factor